MAVTDTVVSIAVVEEGPLAVELSATSKGKGVRSATRNFYLVAGQPWMETTNMVADKNPNIQPIIDIDNPKVYSTIVKSLDTDNAFVIRLRSLSDKAEHVKLSFTKKEPKEINVCDWGETPKEKTGKDLELNPYGLVTLRVAY